MKNKDRLRQLFEKLYIGRENKITIDRLMRDLNLSSRVIRNFIKELRLSDRVEIISNSNGDYKGYFCYRGENDNKQVKIFLNEVNSRIRELLKLANMAKRILNRQVQRDLDLKY